MTRRRNVMAGVAAGLLLVVGVAELTASAPKPPRAERVAVAATELVCPYAPVSNESGAVVRSRLSMVSADGLADGAADQASAGSIRLGRLGDDDSLVSRAPKRRAVSTSAPSTGTYVGVGEGARAPGLALDLLTVSGRTSDHGLAGMTCTAPVNDAWFVGAGTAVGRDSVIHLVNPEPAPAIVDVQVHSSKGKVDTPAATGVDVGPNSAVQLKLSALAPGVGDVALRVVATSGRVAVGVLETEVSGLKARGADWLPQAAEPERRVVIPGLLSGGAARRLSIFAPGTGTATVDVKVVGEQGEFVPTGGGPVDIDRGRVSTVDLGAGLASDQAAVVIDSPVPVVAGVRWQPEGEISDFAFSAGAVDLTSAAVFPGLTLDRGARSILMLTAPRAAAKVELQVLVDGRPDGDPRMLDVKAGTTLRTDAATGRSGRFAVRITPQDGSGPVHGAIVRTAQVEGFGGLTLSTLFPARATVAVPRSQQDLGVLVDDRADD
jgi:hypothetical protein